MEKMVTCSGSKKIDINTMTVYDINWSHCTSSNTIGLVVCIDSEINDMINESYIKIIITPTHGESITFKTDLSNIRVRGSLDFFIAEIAAKSSAIVFLKELGFSAYELDGGGKTKVSDHFYYKFGLAEDVVRINIVNAPAIPCDAIPCDAIALTISFDDFKALSAKLKEACIRLNVR